MLTGEQFPLQKMSSFRITRRKWSENIATFTLCDPIIRRLRSTAPLSGEEHKQRKPHVRKYPLRETQLFKSNWIRCWSAELLLNKLLFLRQLRRVTEALSWFRNHTTISLVQLLCVDNKNAWLKGKGEQAGGGGNNEWRKVVDDSPLPASCFNLLFCCGLEAQVPFCQRVHLWSEGGLL